MARNGGVAQFWLERRTVTAEVAGSSPVAPAILIVQKHYGELAQLARALALHARGQEFDSPILHHLSLSKLLRIMPSNKRPRRANYSVNKKGPVT